MSLLDGFKTDTKPAAKKVPDAELGNAFAELVAAKVAARTKEIESNADARIQEAIARAVQDAKKVEEDADAKAHAKLGERIAKAEKKQQDAEAFSVQLNLAKAKAEGLLETERAARQQADKTLKEQDATLKAVRAELAAAQKVVAPVRDVVDPTPVLAAALQRIEKALTTPKRVEDRELIVDVRKDDMGRIKQLRIKKA